MRTLNLGILAHVDAGKTSLTERLLYAAGVIDRVGRVDDGSTQTDFLALERQRGITIKSAVVSFVINDVTVNLVDTPGHPDFIAEVERVLSVLDGVVLVLSAVEGVQAQTRVLMRALQRLKIPTLFFVNKIDRVGARYEHLIHEIAERLTLAIVPMGTVRDLGTRNAAFAPYGPGDVSFKASLTNLLADNDDAFLAAYMDNAATVSYGPLLAELAAQTGRGLVHPVFYGSAITGAGVDSLTAGITELLPACEGDIDSTASGAVFKIERGPAGEKIAYARVFSGSVRTRDRLRFRGDNERTVTAVAVFEGGAVVPRASIFAGQIGKFWGLGAIQIGDTFGLLRTTSEPYNFAPPTLETVIVPRRPEDKGALRVALDQLLEQDPLINLRQDDSRQEMYVSLYGEVQKEVIQATLANDFDIGVDFWETTAICIERPVGVGAAVEILQEETNPTSATVGLVVRPAAAGSGVRFQLDVNPRCIPLYIYKTTNSFVEHMTQYVLDTLRDGLFGWTVTDCTVTLNECNYYIGDGPGKPSGNTPRTIAADFRILAPLVLRAALKKASTVVCEPIHRFHIEIPADAVGLIAPALALLGGFPRTTEMIGSSCLLEGQIPAARVNELQRQLATLTRGEGVLESAFSHY